MKFIITESQHYDLKFRRRTHIIDDILEELLKYLYPCDASNSSHFFEMVIFDLINYIENDSLDINLDDVISYIKENKKDYIEQYYLDAQENCI